MQIKEMRLQGPNVQRSTGTLNNIRILVRPHEKTRLDIIAQRSWGEKKIEGGLFSGKDYLVTDITSLFRATTCTVTGECVEAALKIARAADFGQPDLEKILATLQGPMTLLTQSGKPRRPS